MLTPACDVIKAKKKTPNISWVYMEPNILIIIGLKAQMLHINTSVGRNQYFTIVPRAPLSVIAGQMFRLTYAQNIIIQDIACHTHQKLYSDCTHVTCTSIQSLSSKREVQNHWSERIHCEIFECKRSYMLWKRLPFGISKEIYRDGENSHPSTAFFQIVWFIEILSSPKHAGVKLLPIHMPQGQEQ